jgi:hypothetical protein
MKKKKRKKNKQKKKQKKKTFNVYQEHDDDPNLILIEANFPSGLEFM